jgi:nicotinate-nucleotide adenylyltransferase
MKRVLLFGGTFDPPHNGHIGNLRAAIAAVRPDLAVVMPAGIPPHKAASATPGRVRLEMCQCFREAGGATPIEISDWEITRSGRSYTVETMAMLKKRFPKAHLYLALGSDMLETFSLWYRWKEILQMATLVVQSREAGDAAALRAAAARLRAHGGRVVFARGTVYPCASHEIRQAVRAGTTQELLPQTVRDCIEKYKLYR